MNRIRTFYRDIKGKYPEMETEPRLREETLAAEAADWSASVSLAFLRFMSDPCKRGLLVLQPRSNDERN
jgi:hypothetical protein